LFQPLLLLEDIQGNCPKIHGGSPAAPLGNLKEVRLTQPKTSTSICFGRLLLPISLGKLPPSNRPALSSLVKKYNQPRCCRETSEKKAETFFNLDLRSQDIAPPSDRVRLQKKKDDPSSFLRARPCGFFAAAAAAAFGIYDLFRRRYVDHLFSFPSFFLLISPWSPLIPPLLNLKN